MAATPSSNRSKERGAYLVLGAIVALYVAMALVVPLGMSWPIVDEPIFATSAFRFAQAGELVISDLSAPNAVFDTIWGGAFARLFGPSLGALRLSTVVLMALSAPFMYAFTRSLGGSRTVALIGTAAYLFAPLSFTLSFTFLTDAHALALTVITAALFTRALTHERWGYHLLLASSTAAALAFLSRPQTLILLPAGAIAWFVHASGRRRLSGIAVLFSVPVVAIAAHTVWTGSVGEPAVRSITRSLAFAEEASEVAVLAGQVVLLAPTYLGLFIAPVVALVMPRSDEIRTWSGSPWRWGLPFGFVVVWLAVTISGWDPFEYQTWVTPTGLGGVDRSHLGARPLLLPPMGWHVVGLGFVVAALAWGSAVSRWLKAREGDAAATFALLMLLGSILGVFLSSLPLGTRVFDRYWLAVLPFVLALGLSQAVITTKRIIVSTLTVGLMALLSLLGTVDSFTAYAEVAEYADELVARGLPADRLEAGASWTAATYGVAEEEPERVVDGFGPYWTRYFASPGTADLAIALEPLDSFTILETREYRSFLNVEPTFIYLVTADDLYADPDNH